VANIPNKILLHHLPDSSASEDRLLWESVKKGNQLAFSALYKKLVNPLYNYGMQFALDADLVKDCIQELFTSIWINRDKLSDVDQVKFYLFKSFRNLIFSKISKSKRAMQDLWDMDREEVEDSKEHEWINEEESLENTRLLKSAMQWLTRRQREAIILRFYNNLDSGQIAEVMGISVEGVHNLVSKAIRLLRENLPR
jgi:RNA polymerase sigma factor (sigma-70 family)